MNTRKTAKFGFAGKNKTEISFEKNGFMGNHAPKHEYIYEPHPEAKLETALVNQKNACKQCWQHRTPPPFFSIIEPKETRFPIKPILERKKEP